MARPTQKSTSNRKKVVRTVTHAKMFVTATLNSTLASVTDMEGNVLCWSSTGESGFTGSRKSTPYAATITIENAIAKARQFGIGELALYIKGAGPGRDVALRVVRAQKIRLSAIIDQTPMPHNGTRPRKAKHNK